MSGACQDFVEHAWRKGVCANCRRGRAGHRVLNPAPKAFKSYSAWQQALSSDPSDNDSTEKVTKQPEPSKRPKPASKTDDKKSTHTTPNHAKSVDGTAPTARRVKSEAKPISSDRLKTKDKRSSKIETSPKIAKPITKFMDDDDDDVIPDRNIDDEKKASNEGNKSSGAHYYHKYDLMAKGESGNVRPVRERKIPVEEFTLGGQNLKKLLTASVEETTFDTQNIAMPYTVVDVSTIPHTFDESSLVGKPKVPSSKPYSPKHAGGLIEDSSNWSSNSKTKHFNTNNSIDSGIDTLRSARSGTSQSLESSLDNHATQNTVLQSREHTYEDIDANDMRDNKMNANDKVMKETNKAVLKSSQIDNTTVINNNSNSEQLKDKKDTGETGSKAANEATKKKEGGKTFFERWFGFRGKADDSESAQTKLDKSVSEDTTSAMSVLGESDLLHEVLSMVSTPQDSPNKESIQNDLNFDLNTNNRREPSETRSIDIPPTEKKDEDRSNSMVEGNTSPHLLDFYINSGGESLQDSVFSSLLKDFQADCKSTIEKVDSVDTCLNLADEYKKMEKSQSVLEMCGDDDDQSSSMVSQESTSPVVSTLPRGGSARESRRRSQRPPSVPPPTPLPRQYSAPPAQQMTDDIEKPTVVLREKPALPAAKPGMIAGGAGPPSPRSVVSSKPDGPAGRLLISTPKLQRTSVNLENTVDPQEVYGCYEEGFGTLGRNSKRRMNTAPPPPPPAGPLASQTLPIPRGKKEARKKKSAEEPISIRKQNWLQNRQGPRSHTLTEGVKLDLGRLDINTDQNSSSNLALGAGVHKYLSRALPSPPKPTEERILEEVESDNLYEMVSSDHDDPIMRSVKTEMPDVKETVKTNAQKTPEPEKKKKGGFFRRNKSKEGLLVEKSDDAMQANERNGAGLAPPSVKLCTDYLEPVSQRSTDKKPKARPPPRVFFDNTSPKPVPRDKAGIRANSVEANQVVGAQPYVLMYSNLEAAEGEQTMVLNYVEGFHKIAAVHQETLHSLMRGIFAEFLPESGRICTDLQFRDFEHPAKRLPIHSHSGVTYYKVYTNKLQPNQCSIMLSLNILPDVVVQCCHVNVLSPVAVFQDQVPCEFFPSNIRRKHPAFDQPCTKVTTSLTVLNYHSLRSLKDYINGIKNLFATNPEEYDQNVCYVLVQVLSGVIYIKDKSFSLKSLGSEDILVVSSGDFDEKFVVLNPFVHENEENAGLEFTKIRKELLSLLFTFLHISSSVSDKPNAMGSIIRRRSSYSHGFQKVVNVLGPDCTIQNIITAKNLLEFLLWGPKKEVTDVMKTAADQSQAYSVWLAMEQARTVSRYATIEMEPHLEEAARMRFLCTTSGPLLLETVSVLHQ